MPISGDECVWVTVAESLSRDLAKVCDWCDLFRMKLNASKIKTMIVSRTRTIHLQSPALTIGGAVLKESAMTLLYWEWHLIPRWLLRSIFARFPEQLLNGSVSWGSHGKYSMMDWILGDRYFRGFVLPVLEYCSAVWCSAADSHLKLLDRVVSGTSYLTGDVFECDLAHRRSVTVLCMLYTIRCNPMHPLYGALPVPYVPVRVTSGAEIAHR